jgi:hypothetical protein
MPVDDAKPKKSAHERLLALTPEMRAKVIRELKRRLEARDAGRPPTFKRPEKMDAPPTPE